MISIYLISFFLCLDILIDRSNRIVDKKKTFIIISFLLLLVFSSLRADNSGNDLRTYLIIFKSTKDYTIFEIISESLNMNHFGSVGIYNGMYESGFVLLCKLISTFTLNSIGFKFVTSLIILFSVSFFIYRNSKLPCISLVVFICLGFYNLSLEVIRQFLAISILLNGINYVKEKKLLSFLVIVFIAFLFHKTSLIYLLVYPVCNNIHFKLNKKNIIIFLSLIMLAFIISKPIIMYIINNYYQFYSDKIISGEGINYLLMLIIFFVFCLFSEKINLQFIDQDIKKIFLLGIIFQLFTVHFSVLYRLAQYFQVYIRFLLSNTTYLYKGKGHYRYSFIKYSLISLLVLFYYFIILQA